MHLANVAEKQRVGSQSRLPECNGFASYIVSLENPERSWLWALLAVLIKPRGDNRFSELYFGLDDVTFDACMHLS